MSNDRLDQLLAFRDQDATDPFVHYALAMEYQRLGQTELALAGYETLRIDFPKYLGTYYQYGKLLQAQGDTPRAIEVFAAGIALATETRVPNTLRELKEALAQARGETDEDDF
jgi:tetratricopeptide (TPR) repeat protein